MKCRLLVLGCLLLPVWNCSAQPTKQLDLPVARDGTVDTSGWYRYTRSLADNVRLNDLRKDTSAFHLRFWSFGQAVDIWTKDSNTYEAAVTSFAQRYDEHLYKKGVRRIAKIYSREQRLDTSVARKLYAGVTFFHVAEMPTDRRIKGWQQGFDGEEFLVEVSTPGSYSFKEYWTPRAFVDSLAEARDLQAFADLLFKEFHLRDQLERLRPPEGTYLHNGVPGIRVETDNSPKLRMRDFF